MIDHLLHRYGDLTADLVEACEADPSLATPLEHAPAYLRAEIAYAATHEGALHLEDILVHRTRLNYESGDRGVRASEEISRIAGAALGWSEATRLEEVASYRARALAEAAAEREPGDAAAERIRLHSPDISPALDPPGAA